MVLKTAPVHGRAMASLRRLAVTVLLALLSPTAANAEQPPTLAVLPFEIHDNSGEVGTTKDRAAMLSGLTRSVAEKLKAAGLYRPVAQSRVDAAVAAEAPGTYLRQCNGCERDIAKRVGADQVLIAWIFRMSSLVLSLHVVVKDVGTGEVLYARVFDFRGDNETAWEHAAKAMVQAMKKSRNGS